MSESDFEIVKSIPNPELRRLVRVKGVDFDETFVAELISNYFKLKDLHAEPKLSDAMTIYLNESDAGDGRKFQGDVLHVYRRFTELIGNLHLCELLLLGFILALGLGTQVNFFSCLAVIAPALLVSYVPISIAGWGVREASFVLAFSLIGVETETALLISLGIGVIVLLVSLLGGVLWAGSGMRQIYMNEARKKVVAVQS